MGILTLCEQDTLLLRHHDLVLKTVRSAREQDVLHYIVRIEEMQRLAQSQV